MTFLFAQFPAPRDLSLPLPVDATILTVMLVPLFLLHILFVNMTVGGSLLTTVFEMIGYWRGMHKWDGLAALIEKSVTVNKSLAVVLGIGPLLIINLLYTLAFYSANALTGHVWILIVPLVTAAFLLTYLHKYTWASWQTGKWKLLHVILGTSATGLFLVIPFIFLANVNLMNYPDRWYDVRGFWSALIIGNGNAFFRYAHFLLASTAVTSIFLCMWLTWRQTAREALPDGLLAPDVRRLFYRIAAWITLGQYAIGPSLLLILPWVGMSTTVVGLILFGAGLGVVMLWLLFSEIRSSDEVIGRRWPWIFVTFSCVAFAMGLGRQTYRDTALTDFHDGVEKRTKTFQDHLAEFHRTNKSQGVPSGMLLYNQVCAACHQMDDGQKAPTLKEIYSLHQGHSDRIVEWAMKPGRKRPHLQVMPSMAHLGKKNLSEIADHMLLLGSGKADLSKLAVDDSRWIRKLPRTEVLKIALNASGNAERGKSYFTTNNCITCHVPSKEGEPSVGPDLANVRDRLSKEKIVESILDPSATIAKGYEVWTLLTTKGQTLSGMIVSEKDGKIRLRQPDRSIVIIAADDVDEKEQGKLSMMPNGLVDNLTPEQLADLVAFVESLRK